MVEQWGRKDGRREEGEEERARARGLQEGPIRREPEHRYSSK